MKITTLIIVASIATLPLSGVAAATGTGTTGGMAPAPASAMQEDDDDEFPWGLLGLLGLAGLLGRKRNDEHINHNTNTRG